MAILKNKNKNPLSNGHQMAKFGGERGIIITLWGGGLIYSSILLGKCNIVVPK
jgi:hypothetical protein